MVNAAISKETPPIIVVWRRARKMELRDSSTTPTVMASVALNPKNSIRVAAITSPSPIATQPVRIPPTKEPKTVAILALLPQFRVRSLVFNVVRKRSIPRQIETGPNIPLTRAALGWMTSELIVLPASIPGMAQSTICQLTGFCLFQAMAPLVIPKAWEMIEVFKARTAGTW